MENTNSNLNRNITRGDKDFSISSFSFSFDFLSLPLDISIMCISFLSVPEIINIGLVSHNYLELIKTSFLWKQLSFNPHSFIPDANRYFLPLEENDCITKKDINWYKLYQELGNIPPYPFFPPSTKLHLVGVKSSSCDNECQSIEMTLDHSPHTFWSSTGSSDINSNEYLFYSFHHGISVIFAVEILVYCAGYQSGLPTYAPQKVQISVSYNNDNDHYNSNTFTVECDNLPKIYILSPPLLLGNYIRLNLLGRTTRQPGDNLYYTCIQNFSVHGMPLSLFSSHFPNLGHFCDQMIQKKKLENVNESKCISNQYVQQQKFEENIYHKIIQLLINEEAEKASKLVYDYLIDNHTLRDQILDFFYKNEYYELGADYLRGLLLQDNFTLNQRESNLFAVIDCSHPSSFLYNFINDNRLTTSEPMGDIYYLNQMYSRAYSVYIHSNIIDKALTSLMMMGRYSSAINLGLIMDQHMDFHVNWTDQLYFVQKHRPQDQTIYFSLLLIQFHLLTPVQVLGILNIVPDENLTSLAQLELILHNLIDHVDHDNSEDNDNTTEEEFEIEIPDENN